MPTLWSIHLMVRIQDSQSWHRGSIPLSTTMKSSSFWMKTFLFLFLWLFPIFVLSLQNETNESL